MAAEPTTRLGNVSAMARIVQAMPPSTEDPVQHKRKMIVEFCRLVGAEYSLPRTQTIPGLSPRHRQTLERLLAGDSEKQIARHLGISPHTIHVYVKRLYKRFEVCSRGELFAKFIDQPTHGSTIANGVHSPHNPADVSIGK